MAQNEFGAHLPPQLETALAALDNFDHTQGHLRDYETGVLDRVHEGNRMLMVACARGKVALPAAITYASRLAFIDPGESLEVARSRASIANRLNSVLQPGTPVVREWDSREVAHISGHAKLKVGRYGLKLAFPTERRGTVGELDFLLKGLVDADGLATGEAVVIAGEEDIAAYASDNLNAPDALEKRRFGVQLRYLNMLRDVGWDLRAIGITGDEARQFETQAIELFLDTSNLRPELLETTANALCAIDSTRTEALIQSLKDRIVSRANIVPEGRPLVELVILEEARLGRRLTDIEMQRIKVYLRVPHVPRLDTII